MKLKAAEQAKLEKDVSTHSPTINKKSKKIAEKKPIEPYDGGNMPFPFLTQQTHSLRRKHKIEEDFK